MDRRRANLEQQLARLHTVASPASLTREIPHQFTELLTVILGRSELVMRRLPPGDPLRGDLDLIRRAAQGGAALARRMASLGELEPRS